MDTNTYFSPEGNPEVWEVKPKGYFTPEEWKELYLDANNTQPISLETIKSLRKMEVDNNTNRIRDRDGLSHAGERFAMSDGAMLKWTGLIAAKDMLPFPMTILTIDDKPFVLADQTTLMQFAGAVLSYETSLTSPLTTGRSLRARIESAQTVEEVLSIVDDRE